MADEVKAAVDESELDWRLRLEGAQKSQRLLGPPAGLLRLEAQPPLGSLRSVTS